MARMAPVTMAPASGASTTVASMEGSCRPPVTAHRSTTGWSAGDLPVGLPDDHLGGVGTHERPSAGVG